MSTSRLAVAASAAFFASTASVWPSLHGAPPPPAPPAARSPFAPAPPKVDAPWPPPGLSEAGPAGVTARTERTASGATRLVVEKTGQFVHLQYREVSAAGPDWASIELRAGDRAPKDDVAVWEHTDPRTLATVRGLVRFSLQPGSEPQAAMAAAPRPGPRDSSALRECQSFEDLASGFAVVCRVGMKTSGVRAIRPASAHPLSGAWVWDVPKSGKSPASRFVRIDLPLSPGGADAGALAFVHAAKGVIVRADASWPSREEPPTLVFTENSRSQPVNPFFSWR
jgi:hypothetical protein